MFFFALNYGPGRSKTEKDWLFKPSSEHEGETKSSEQMKMLTMTTINNAEHLLCPFVLPLEITAVNLRAVK